MQIGSRWSMSPGTCTIAQEKVFQSLGMKNTSYICQNWVDSNTCFGHNIKSEAFVASETPSALNFTNFLCYTLTYNLRVTFLYPTKYFSKRFSVIIANIIHYFINSFPCVLERLFCHFNFYSLQVIKGCHTGGFYKSPIKISSPDI